MELANNTMYREVHRVDQTCVCTDVELHPLPADASQYAKSLSVPHFFIQTAIDHTPIAMTSSWSLASDCGRPLSMLELQHADPATAKKD